MTIKNTKKNISAENGEIVQNLSITTPTKANNNSNFSTNQTVTITFMDFFEEGNQPRTVSVAIPTSELVRLGYLQNNYYTKSQTYSKTEIDSKVKLHYEVLQSVPNMTNKQWAESVRQAGKQNYIFLIPFGSDYENDNSEETDQEGYYIEYFYSIEDNDNTYATEKMERMGSTKIDLTPYLKIANLNSQLLQASNFTAVQSKANTNATNISALQTSKVDKAQNVANGVLTTDSSKNVTVSSSLDRTKISGFSNANYILVTNSSKQIDSVNTLADTKITHSTALSNIGSSANANQSTINGLIDSKFQTITGNISTIQNDYELKADLRADTWGSGGFLTLQDAETSNSPTKNLKLGDYIYQHLYANFYSKAEIDNLIGTLSQLQQNTLAIL